MIDKTTPREAVSSAMIVAAVLLFLAALLGMADSCESGFAVNDIRQGKAAGCFEFWFNRYQTFISGALALAAAAYAAKLVLRQLRLMEGDRSIGIQDLIIRRSRELEDLQKLAGDIRVFGIDLTRSAHDLRAAKYESTAASFMENINWWTDGMERLAARAEVAYGGFMGGLGTSLAFKDAKITLRSQQLKILSEILTLPVVTALSQYVDQGILEEQRENLNKVADLFEEIGNRIADRGQAAEAQIDIDRDRLHQRLRDLEIALES